MKKTLLALMLVSSLFVISCGADSTKPEDLKSTSYESTTGTSSANVAATANIAIDAATIYAGLTVGTYDSVKITKIVSMKSLDATTGQYTTDVAFTETTNVAGDIVLSVTPTTAGLTGNVEIAYQYKIDTYPTDSTGTVDVSTVAPTLQAEVIYSQATHAAGITVTDPALSLGKKYMYKLYTGDYTEPTATTPADIATEGSITIPITTTGTLTDGSKVYYKIWVY